MITFVRFGLGKQEGGGGLGRPGGVGLMGERVRKLVSPPPPNEIRRFCGAGGLGALLLH